MKNLLYFGALAFFAMSASSCQDDRKGKNYNQKTTVDDQGIVFIKEASVAGLAEIKAANVALSKSKNPRVLNFAKMMITDHTTIGNELKGLAEKKYVEISDDNSDHQQMIDSVSKLSGPAFDKAYMAMMVADHTKAVELFKDVTRNRIKTVNDFAEKTLPVMIMHLDSAKAINASVNN